MTLKEFMQQNQITIKDLALVANYPFERVLEIVDKDAKTSTQEKNRILNAIVKFKLNPMKIIFKR